MSNVIKFPLIKIGHILPIKLNDKVIRVKVLKILEKGVYEVAEVKTFGLGEPVILKLKGLLGNKYYGLQQE